MNFHKAERTTALTSPSITVVQGAYESFCVPSKVVAESYRIAPVAAPDNACPFIGVGLLDLSMHATGADFVAILASDVTLIADLSVEDWLKFQSLVAQWQQERGATSSITEAAMCPAYQSILGMGPAAVPLLLAQLQSEGNEPDQWFWALKAITRMDPVRDEDRGDYVAMARAWLMWAANTGYAW